MQKNKNDFYLIVLASTNDLTAAEAQYHSSRYTDYTRPVTGKKVIEKSDYQKLELETFQEVLNIFMISFAHQVFLNLKSCCKL